MVNVNIGGLNSERFDDDSLVKFYGIALGEEDNWGDDDCLKMVTEVYSCDVKIDASIKNIFINENNEYKTISFIRYGYYRPAYHIDTKRTGFTVVENDDGSITYQIRLKKS